MAFRLLNKARKCPIQDELFMEVSWSPNHSPAEDEKLNSLIEQLDENTLAEEQFHFDETLPYLTFLQAEVLFQEIKQEYESFLIEKISVCRREGGRITKEGEVFVQPLLIDASYQNLLQPLMESILIRPEFSTYSYDEKRDYFINQVFPSYRASLDVSETSLPLFPSKKEVHSKGSIRIPAISIQRDELQQQRQISHPLKKVYLILGIIGSLLCLSLGVNTWLLANQKQADQQIHFLYKELKKTTQLQKQEHQLDVFSRYFLPSYYSNNKQLLTDFLDKGNAKYTVPKEGTLQSVILEKISYEAGEYTATYVLALKRNDGIKSIRLTLVAKEKKSSPYGFVITKEPIETAYIKSKK
ncbi:hypothetical protein D8825_05945 [Streptococcus intermedius]|uniref:hypothetical protein n=1 Tax=Streptococcus intermedius TaxID=1338 RepID=UPI000F681179|nr:hypothetical protein [Streptococcus intermedius]RSJ26937.1 hypothetical protein D8825_05945 [Streptococcus intermedius]